MGSNVIQVHFPNQASRDSDRDEYIARLRVLSDALRQMAGEFGETTRSALADFTYIAVSDDIMTSLEELEE